MDKLLSNCLNTLIDDCLPSIHIHVNCLNRQVVFEKEREMNAELKLASVLIVAGPTGSGKTTFTIDLLKDANNLFDIRPDHFIWHYGEIEPKGLP